MMPAEGSVLQDPSEELWMAGWVSNSQWIFLVYGGDKAIIQIIGSMLVTLTIKATLGTKWSCLTLHIDPIKCVIVLGLTFTVSWGPSPWLVWLCKELEIWQLFSDTCAALRAGVLGQPSQYKGAWYTNTAETVLFEWLNTRPEAMDLSSMPTFSTKLMRTHLSALSLCLPICSTESVTIMLSSLQRYQNI